MKKHFLYTIITLSVIIFWSCERDDICSASVTTPHLIIRSYDINEQENTSVIEGLKVFALNDADEPFNISEYNVVNTDSIVLPLRTDADQTKFIFHFNYEETTENDQTIITGNPDIVTVNYTREDVYVSRACGFKTIFNNLTFSVENETDNPDPDLGNWILQSTIINNTIDNENNAHVTIFF